MVRQAILFVVTAVLFCCVRAYAADYKAAENSLAEWKTESQAANDAAAQNDAESVGSHQAKAQLALARAARQYESAGAATCNDPDVLRKYAEVRIRLMDFDLAAEALKRLTDMGAANAEPWLLYGHALSELGSSRANEAVAALNKAIEFNASPALNANAHHMLGLVYRKERLFDLARRQFESAIEADPTFAIAKVALAGEKIRAGQVMEAAADLDQLGQPPPEAAALIPKTVEDALDGFTASRHVFPDTAENHMAYAKLLFRGNRVQDCLMAAERAVALAPDNYAGWNFIGDISRQTGATQRAREAYQKSLAIKPDQPVTQKALAEMK